MALRQSSGFIRCHVVSVNLRRGQVVGVGEERFRLLALTKEPFDGSQARERHLPDHLPVESVKIRGRRYARQ